jgi:hypothetical protein
MRETVKVLCSVPNGIELRTYAPGYDDGTGTGNQIAPRVGDVITLAGPSALMAGVNAPEGVPVETEVDAAAWGRWLDQNEKHQHPLIASGQVFERK